MAENLTISTVKSVPREKVTEELDEEQRDEYVKELKEQVESLREKLLCRDDEITRLKSQNQERLNVIRDSLISLAKAEREVAIRKVQLDTPRLGKMRKERIGQRLVETWENGDAFKDLDHRLVQLSEEKERLESYNVKQVIFLVGADSEEDRIVQYEIYTTQLERIEREEEVIQRQIKQCEREKKMMIAEMKRLKDEDESQFFKNHRVLNDRYLLLNLIGKGGFCEIFKAFDMVENRCIVCKIHTMNNLWSEERKLLFVKHLTREQYIHKKAIHNNIVKMLDCLHFQDYGISVLEYCKGKDLSFILQERPLLPEDEAKSIITQVFRGLVYLNGLSPKVIHYDLKPGNILFDDDYVVKLTDFGISKLVEEEGANGMKLSTEGFGTYWYLPPECFVSIENAFISSKVDVWSAGVILYEMLYGRVPFGHDKTQPEILREGTILGAYQVQFPESEPPVSQEAKDFIMRCLTYNKDDRPDILEIVKDPFLGLKITEKPKSTSNFSSFFASLKG